MSKPAPLARADGVSGLACGVLGTLNRCAEGTVKRNETRRDGTRRMRLDEIFGADMFAHALSGEMR